MHIPLKQDVDLCTMTAHTSAGFHTEDPLQALKAQDIKVV